MLSGFPTRLQAALDAANELQNRRSQTQARTLAGQTCGLVEAVLHVVAGARHLFITLLP